MHNEKPNVHGLFVVPESSPALLGMPDIETLGVLTIDDKTIDRKLACKRQRNFQCERAVQTEGGKLVNYADNRQDIDIQRAAQAEGGKSESSTKKRQDADRHSQHSADNNIWSSVITNPMITDNNNNENSFKSDPPLGSDRYFLLFLFS